MISQIINFGRVLGASAIFYFHVGLATDHHLSQWGEFAVAFFIILSGLAYTGFSSMKPTDRTSYRQYIVGRVRAIFPMFFAINCAIFFASFIHPSGLGRPFTFTEFLLSSVGLSQYCGYRYLSNVMWFVPFIMQAYLVLPLVDRLLDRVSGVVVVMTAFIVSLSLIAFVFDSWPARAEEICRNWSIIFRLPEVCIGVIAGRCIFQRSGRRAGLAAIAVYALVSLVLATICEPHPDPQRYILSLPYNGLIVTTAIFLAAAAVAAIVRNWKEDRLLRLLGTAAFPFFLMHSIAIMFVNRQFGTNLLVWLFYFAFCWIAAIVLTILLRSVERAAHRDLPFPATRSL